MSNSSLVTCTKISPFKNSPRNHSIDTITIHCAVGWLTAPQLLNEFSRKGKEASANYVIGKDGDIGLCVEEKDRSWCSSSSSNDNRAITIECASGTCHPYIISEETYDSLIKLVTDICKRNNIKELKWKNDKNLVGQIDKQNLTVHRWFANKACPGDYIMSLLPKIVSTVNANLNKTKTIPYLVKVDIADLNIRKGPGTNYAKTGSYTGKGTFTIIEERSGQGSIKGWGKLKSGAGWISLDYANEV